MNILYYTNILIFIYISHAICISIQIYIGLFGFESHPIPFFIPTIATFQQVLHKWHYHFIKNLVVHTMSTMEHLHIRSKMLFKLFSPIHGRILVPKESPTKQSVGTIYSIKHMRFHVPKLLYGIFRYSKVCLPILRWLEVFKCSRFKYIC